MIGLCLLVTFSGWVAAFALRHEMRSREYEQEMLPTAETDEDVLGVLEASGADIAPRLLAAAQLLDEDAEWRHTNGVSTPATAYWNLMKDDLALETNEKDRLAALSAWLDRGMGLTTYEMVEVSKLFKDPAMRREARELMTISKMGVAEEEDDVE